jgi:hypothetical protein
MPNFGFAAAPPVAFVNVTPYVPVIFTFAPTLGTGFGRSPPQNSSASLTSLYLPFGALSIASIMLKSCAKFDAQPMTGTTSFSSPFSSAM